MEIGADHASVFTYSSLKSHRGRGVSFCLPGKPGEGRHQCLPPNPSPGHFGGAGARLGRVKSFLAENSWTVSCSCLPLFLVRKHHSSRSLDSATAVWMEEGPSLKLAGEVGST